MENIKLKQPIYSFTLKDLYTARDGNFIHHDKYTAELSEPVLEYAYCNTLKFKIKSSHYGEKTKEGTNRTEYTVFILFQDFYTIGKDKDIPFEDAINYAIDYGDVKCRCTCPAQNFWGYNYIDTQLRALYGIPVENRYPHIRNPKLAGVMCKHIDKVIQWIFKNRDIVFRLFALYYNRLQDGQSIYAVNSQGNTITIGHKNEDGDVFFEKQVEEEEMKNKDKNVEETQENTEIDEMNPDTWFEEDDETNVTETEEE